MALTIVLYAAVILVSLLLIGLVLVQPSKSGGLGATFGGIGESVFGAQAGSHLTKLTVIMTTIFFVLTLTLAVMLSYNKSSETVSDVTEKLMEIQSQESATKGTEQTTSSETVQNLPETPAETAVN